MHLGSFHPRSTMTSRGLELSRKLKNNQTLKYWRKCLKLQRHLFRILKISKNLKFTKTLIDCYGKPTSNCFQPPWKPLKKTQFNFFFSLVEYDKNKEQNEEKKETKIAIIIIYCQADFGEWSHHTQQNTVMI